MPRKNPAWTRKRVGRNRVLWVAYDDRVGAEGCQIVAQGYASSLKEADTAARSTLAASGMYQARRMSSTSRSTAPEKRPRPTRLEPSRDGRPRCYLYTRQFGDAEGLLISAHLIIKKTTKRVYVSRRSCGPDQLGTEDERWGENEPAIALDRVKLESDGSVYSSGHRLSDFFATREAAIGDHQYRGGAAFRALGISPPASVADIKSAYRQKALEAHPDRGGNPSEFQMIEAAYRQLLHEANVSDG